MNESGAWFHPNIRKTFKYVPSCSHMDEWEPAEWQARVCSTGRVEDHNDEDNMEDSHSIHTIIETDVVVTEEQVTEAFKGDLAEGCSCEHDCCGHFHGGLTRVIPFDHHKYNTGKSWLLVSGYSRNY